MPAFTNPALPIAALRQLMEQRGMIVADPLRAEHYLRFIGYHRLSGYWFPFQRRDGSAEHNHFRAPISFDDILDLYVFDRKLRVLVMDALERIEVAIRTSISEKMSAVAGPHWFLDSVSFIEGFDHGALVKRIGFDVGLPNTPKGQSQFIASYYAAYDEPRLPPSWVVFEVISFGTISRIFENLEKAHRKSIAAVFGLPEERLRSWMHALTHLRNLCAHHERIWNRAFGVSPSVPKSERLRVTDPKRFYVMALVIQILLLRISEETHWGDRLASLFGEHPTIDTSDMGFPASWRDRPVWTATSTIGSPRKFGA